MAQSPCPGVSNPQIRPRRGLVRADQQPHRWESRTVPKGSLNYYQDLVVVSNY